MEPIENQPQLSEFAVFLKHVGIWQGDWIRIDHNAQETTRFTGLLTQKIIGNQWIQTNEHEFADGKKVTQSFVGRVVGMGRVAIESADPPFFTYSMIAQEVADHLLVFDICDKATGKILATETINLTSVRRGFSLRFERLLPPKSPILGNFEPEILAQSPSLVGDLGGFPNS